MTSPVQLPELPAQPSPADCDEFYGQAPMEAAWYWPSIQKMLTAFATQAVLAERERCALVCDERAMRHAQDDLTRRRKRG